MSSRRTYIELPTEHPPLLVVLIDVEEEFDWDQEFDRSATDVTHVERFAEGMEVFQPFGVVPVGVVSYPVAAHPEAGAILRELVTDGRLVLGAHLHPWVNPPHAEEVNRYNSFPGNLDAGLEADKLAHLTDAIEQNLGERPLVYQAGRYGMGKNTPAILESQGYRVSMTVNPSFDYRSEGGPDYTAARNTPYWFGSRRPLLELPITGAFIGSAGKHMAPLYQFANTRPMRSARLPAVLSRLGLVERIRLSPEGHSNDDMQRLTHFLLHRGLRIFTFSFHSPTLMPGCTSYVRTEAERDEFLERIRSYLEFFQNEVGGRVMAPLDLFDLLEGKSPAGDPALSPATSENLSEPR